MQRDVIRAPAEAGGELAVGELGGRIAAHRSNVRRAVQLLVGRGDVVELVGPGGGRCLRLGERLALLPMLENALARLDPPEEEPPRPSMEELRAELRRAREEWEAEVPTFYRAGPGARERALLRPGPIQRKVLAALWHVPDPVDGGLPRAAVAQIVGGGGVRRAVRSLLRAGRLEASECGRVRLSRQEAFWFDLRARAGLLFEEEPDAEHARAVLRRFGWEVPDERARKGDTRCVGAASAKLGANDNHGKA